MKVLMINSVCGIRSTGRICTDIAEKLEKNGYEVKIAYGRESVPDKHKRIAVRIGTEFGVKIDGIKSRMLDDAGFNSKKATEEFLKWADDYNPDILHLHNIHGYYINIELLFNWIKKRPDMRVIWTLHDCWAFTGHCSHYDYIKCDKWKTGCTNCPQINEYPKSIFLDQSRKNWEKKKMIFSNVPNMTIITPSNWLANQVKMSFLNSYPIVPIYNGIDLNVFKPVTTDFRKRYDLINNTIVLGVASSWSKNKGLDDFLSLSELLDERYKIILVGLTKKQINKLPNNIIGIERTNSIKELVEIYSVADVFVNPSKEETMGLTTVEAMACGTPSVVFNCTALPELINKKNGIVVPIEERKKLNKYIKTIIESNLDNVRESCFIYDKYKQYERYILEYER